MRGSGSGSGRSRLLRAFLLLYSLYSERRMAGGTFGRQIGSTMNIEEIRDYCLEKVSATEAFPFDEDTMVFRVGDTVEKPGRIFALCSLERPDYILLKCDPDRAVELRDRYPDEIEPGWHMNKRHWNGVSLGGPHLTDSRIREMIDHSYRLVAASLPKRQRVGLGLENG